LYMAYYHYQCIHAFECLPQRVLLVNELYFYRYANQNANIFDLC